MCWKSFDTTRLEGRQNSWISVVVEMMSLHILAKGKRIDSHLVASIVPGANNAMIHDDERIGGRLQSSSAKPQHALVRSHEL
jgi:hypothetical protein